ncbi:MAG: signal peptidase II [Micropepsaceae bacterium]
MSVAQSRRFLVFGLLLALIVLVADQASKNWALYGLGFINCPACLPIEVTPFFNLTMVWNEGISYGLFPADSANEKYLLIGFSILMALILTWWLVRADGRWLAAGLGLVIGGAIGNVIDRFLYGAVVDFFHFHGFGYSWYVFNVADAAIVLGVGAILVDAVFMGRAAGGTEAKG